MGGSAVRVVAVDPVGEVPVARLADPLPGRARVARPAAPLARPGAGRAPRRVGVGPEPAGPGRAYSWRASAPVGPVRRGAAGRPSAARPVPVRPVPARPVPRRAGCPGGRGGRLSAAVRFTVVAVLAAVAVGGLGLLADAVRAARVPEVTGLVRVLPGESLWQVARRAAPSADPGAVAARIVELNDLGSPSVRDGDVLVSPIG